MTAHQRLIAEKMAAKQPRKRIKSLSGFGVETITSNDARPLIMKYEWLGTVGRSTTFVGLVSPRRELCGVACFGYGPAGKIRTLIGEPALCLERGACVHYAPPNSASFLINAACKLIYRTQGIDKFFAYADPGAGEYGGVYQAAGWLYLGQGLDGDRGRKLRFAVLRPGDDPNVASNWKSTRELRRNGKRMTFDTARELGWRIAMREAKHVYATNVGRDRRCWKAAINAKPYPSPQPELKLSYVDTDETFMIESPPTDRLYLSVRD